MKIRQAEAEFRRRHQVNMCCWIIICGQLEWWMPVIRFRWPMGKFGKKGNETGLVGVVVLLQAETDPPIALHNPNLRVVCMQTCDAVHVCGG